MEIGKRRAKAGWRSWLSFFPFLIVALMCYGPVANPVLASQQTPPVSIDLKVVPGQEPFSLTVELSITANVRVSNAVFVIETQAPVKSDTMRLPLQLEPKRPFQTKIRLRTDKEGEHVLNFAIKAQAEGYVTAGTNERRYLVVDGKNPARLMTGQELRRGKREGVIKKLNEQLRKDPNSGVTLDTYLAGRLEQVEGPIRIEVRRPQALASPAPGIEPWEKGIIIDNSDKVMRDLDPITVIGRALFRDRNGNLQPFVNATIDIRDDDFGPDEQITSTITNWNGDFSAVVNNDDGWFQDGRDIYIRIRATNSRFRVQDCSYWPDWTYDWVTGTRDNLSDGTVVDFGSFWLVDYQEAAILF